MVLQYLQWGGVRNLSEQSVPVHSHPHGKEVLPTTQVEVPVPQFLPATYCPSAWHHQEEPDFIFLAASTSDIFTD